MRALILLSLFPLPVAAQQVATLPATLSPDVAEVILARPDRFADLAADLIHGHGTAGAITPTAIETAIALDRAFFRTRALRPFHESDLDADGRITTPEITARAAALSPPARARLMRDLAAADTDADGTLSPAELATHAEAAVARASRPMDEALLRAVAAFDTDADGQASLAEITRALPTAPPTD